VALNINKTHAGRWYRQTYRVSSRLDCVRGSGLEVVLKSGLRKRRGTGWGRDEALGFILN